MTPPSVDELVCREFVEWVTDHLEWTLPTGRESAVVGHLAGCPGCAAYLAQLQVVGELAVRLRTSRGRAGTAAVLAGVLPAWQARRR